MGLLPTEWVKALSYKGSPLVRRISFQLNNNSMCVELLYNLKYATDRSYELCIYCKNKDGGQAARSRTDWYGVNRYLSGRMPDTTKAKKEHSSSVALLGHRLTASRSVSHIVMPMANSYGGLYGRTLQLDYLNILHSELFILNSVCSLTNGRQDVIFYLKHSFIYLALIKNG